MGSEGDQPYHCQYSLDDPRELQGFLVCRVLCARSQACCCFTQASFQVQVSNRLEALDTTGDPEELWDTFKVETLETANKCIGERPRSRSGLTSVKTLESIEESRAARPESLQDATTLCFVLRS